MRLVLDPYDCETPFAFAYAGAGDFIVDQVAAAGDAGLDSDEIRRRVDARYAPLTLTDYDLVTLLAVEERPAYLRLVRCEADGRYRIPR